MSMYYGSHKVKRFYFGTQNTNCLTHIPNDINLELDPLNVTVTGSPTVSSGVVSGFSSANYLTLPETFSPGSSTWETVIKIKFSSVSGTEYFFGTKDYNSFLIGKVGNKFKIWISSNGSSWNVAQDKATTYTVVADTQYWVKFRFTGSAYILSYSTNGTSFTDDITVSSTATIKGGSKFVIGYGWKDNPMTTGTVDLTGCYVKVGNNTIWQGGTGKLTLKKGSKVYVPNGTTEQKYFKTSTSKRDTGTYTFIIDKECNAKLLFVGNGGGGGSGQRDSKWFQSSGGSGACFEGLIKLPAGTYTVTIGTLGYGYNVDNNSSCDHGIDSTDSFLTDSNGNELIRVGCGARGTTSSAGGNGGTLTLGTLKVVTTLRNKNGNQGNNINNGSPSSTSGYALSAYDNTTTGYGAGTGSWRNGGNVYGIAGIFELMLESTADDSDYIQQTGQNIFDEVVISSDTSIGSSGSTSQQLMILYNSETNEVYRYSQGAVFSGNSQPTVTQTYNMWYDTANNVFKRSYDTGATWVNIKLALPIGLSTVVNGSFTSIDQVFNGFGYIGSTVFALPNVKGLIPNGFNDDGTYNSKEIEIKSVLTYNSTYNQTVFTSGTNLNARNKYYEVNTYNDMISNNSNGLYYVRQDNKCYSWSGGTGVVYEGYLRLYDILKESGVNKITSLTPNPVQPEKIGREISRIYKGSTLVYGYKPNTLLLEKSTAGTYSVTIKHSGDYEVTIVGGGGGGAYNVSTKFSDGVISGGSGAGFKGIIHFKSGTYNVIVGAGGTSVNPGNASTAMPSVGSSSSIGNIITAGCANADGTANAGFNGSGNVISKGGVLTYDQSAVRSYTIASNGNDGLQGWNTSVVGASSVISGTTYGAGDKGQNGAMSKGYDGYVKIVAI